ncbi:ganglioside GM2 activator [Alligator sinensis]|uniref:Ganglioside GM2 activator n=1 Tax=Alligator sinensis TaxID=38654 RepID=A0A3Q0GBD4_ALLSI|nr:ganglioside GM2 activator [Alligator sinensis]
MWRAQAGIPAAARPEALCRSLFRETPDRPTAWCLQVRGFSWEDCGGGKDPIVLRSLSIAPDPITIPGNVKVSASVTSSTLMTSPLKGVVTVERKVAEIWIQIPCIDQMGSCTYDNLCSILDDIIPPGEPCPEPLVTYGIPCHCPFKAGSYSLPTSDFALPDIELPSWLTNGDYRIRGVVSYGGKELSCVQLELSVHSN